MEPKRGRRVLLCAAVIACYAPVFSRADDGKPAKEELQLELAPNTGYGRYAICDSLSRVRYGGLGASGRYRHGAFATKVGGSSQVVHKRKTTYYEDEEEEPRYRTDSGTTLESDALAQVGVDFPQYFAFLIGAGVRLDRAIVYPSGSLRFGPSDGLSLRLGLADSSPMRLVFASADLAYQHEKQFRIGLGVRGDAFALTIMPAARFELPLDNGHWLGAAAGMWEAEGAIAWQAQLLLTLQLYSAPHRAYR